MLLSINGKPSINRSQAQGSGKDSIDRTPSVSDVLFEELKVGIGKYSCIKCWGGSPDVARSTHHSGFMMETLGK